MVLIDSRKILFRSVYVLSKDVLLDNYLLLSSLVRGKYLYKEATLKDTNYVFQVHFQECI